MAVIEIEPVGEMLSLFLVQVVLVLVLVRLLGKLLKRVRQVRACLALFADEAFVRSCGSCMLSLMCCCSADSERRNHRRHSVGAVGVRLHSRLQRTPVPEVVSGHHFAVFASRTHLLHVSAEAVERLRVVCLI
jgi:hypothetical protein